MAFWGAPLPNDNHTYDACLAVLNVKKQVNMLNEQWQAQGKPPLITRYGVNTGDAVAGTIGSSERMNYTVLGDIVNVASRLEGLNRQYGTSIIVSEAVHDQVGNDFVMRPVDIVAVKGRNVGIRIYELLGTLTDNRAPQSTDLDKQLCTATRDALDAYISRNWDESISLFETIKKNFPTDGIPDVFITRCNEYKANPPDAAWQGVFEAKVK